MFNFYLIHLNGQRIEIIRDHFKKSKHVLKSAYMLQGYWGNPIYLEKCYTGFEMWNI